MRTIGVLLPLALVVAQIALLVWRDVPMRALLAVACLALAIPVGEIAAQLDPAPADCSDGWCSGAALTLFLSVLISIPIVVMSLVRSYVEWTHRRADG